MPEENQAQNLSPTMTGATRSVAELCRREGIHPTIYYKWLKDFMKKIVTCAISTPRKCIPTFNGSSGTPFNRISRTSTISAFVRPRRKAIASTIPVDFRSVLRQLGYVPQKGKAGSKRYFFNPGFRSHFVASDSWRDVLDQVPELSPTHPSLRSYPRS